MPLQYSITAFIKFMSLNHSDIIVEMLMFIFVKNSVNMLKFCWQSYPLLHWVADMWTEQSFYYNHASSAANQ